MAVTESGRARARRLLRETRCECGEQAQISTPQGNGKYVHECFQCAFGIPRRTATHTTPVILPDPPVLATEFHIVSADGDHDNPVKLKGYRRQRIRHASRGGTYASPHNEKAVWMRPSGGRSKARPTNSKAPRLTREQLLKELGL